MFHIRSVRLLRWFVFIWFLGLLPLPSQEISTPSKKKPERIPVAQNQLTNYTPAMGEADFWIAKMPNPQGVIWSRDRIRQYNQQTLRKGFVLDPFKMGSTIRANSLRNYLDKDLKFIRTYIKYDTQGVRRRDPEFGNLLKSIIGYKEIGDNYHNIEYGLVLDKEAELRYFPTDLQIYRTREDREFEIFKKSHLEIFSPVAILWRSQDRNWYYVETPISRGWIQKKYVVTASRQEVMDFFSGESQGVVVNPLAKTYQMKNDSSENPSLSLPMGTRIYVRNYVSEREFTEIIIPQQETSDPKKLTKKILYVKTTDIRPDYLHFTYENLAKQAFKLLGTGYSWGGSYDRTDCSLFLYRVFASFGLNLPRSSSQQITSLQYEKVTSEISSDYSSYSNKIENFRTLAHIPGPTHILLYLGEHGGRDFYIHSTWSYYGRDQNEYLIRSVVVSDLSLGEGGKSGSLEKRISLLGFL